MAVICGIPSMVLLALGNPQWGGITFWVLFAGGFITALFRNQLVIAGGLAISVTPWMNLFRQFAFYNVVVALFGILLCLLAIQLPHQRRLVLSGNPIAITFLSFFAAYYAVSILITHDYSNNLRLLEFAFSAICLVFVGRDRKLLAQTLMGILICSGLVALGMLPHNEDVGRLGIAVVDGYQLGNPVQLGLPLALSLLALTVDRGRWLDLCCRPTVRTRLLLVITPLLALTTSRASWFVAGIGIILAVIFGNRQRLTLLLLLGVVAVGVKIALLSPYTDFLQHGYNQTFAKENDLSKRSSGRFDQWQVAYFIITSSISNLVIGCGPGRGPEAYAYYSMQAANADFHNGEKMALHSLFMQLGVEAGLIGLLPSALWLLVVSARAVRQAQQTKLLLPLICLCGYVLVVMTVSGNDTNCGVLLGMGLMVQARSGAGLVSGLANPRCPGNRLGRDSSRYGLQD